MEHDLGQVETLLTRQTVAAGLATDEIVNRARLMGSVALIGTAVCDVQMQGSIDGATWYAMPVYPDCGDPNPPTTGPPFFIPVTLHTYSYLGVPRGLYLKGGLGGFVETCWMTYFPRIRLVVTAVTTPGTLEAKIALI